MSGDIYDFVFEVPETSAVPMFLDVKVEDDLQRRVRRYHIRYDTQALAFLETTVKSLKQHAGAQHMLRAALDRKIDADVFYGDHEHNGKEYR